MHPAAAVLHYAEEIFEGLKAYRHADGSVWLFRPERNARRFDRSARRMALPPLGEQNFLGSLDTLIRTDEPWVPTPDSSHCLYLRPFMFATDPLLGVRPPQQVTYTAIASPAAPLFGSGADPIRLWISAEYTRAAPGGTGAAKCAVATMPRASPPRSKPTRTAVIRRSTSTARSVAGWKRRAR